jgi:3-hydroxyisobutyrate dehydrogenase-like beta-hydroxyacid dehydrogenase
MAANVLKGGYRLVIYNRTRERTKNVERHGATVAESPREVAAPSDVVITMLSDPDAVRTVLEGDAGILAGARAGLVYMDMSTVGPADARATVAQAEPHGVCVIHAPVLGSLGPAEEGELVILAGGDRDVVEAQRPLLQTMGKTIRYMGSNEQACVTKLAVNIMLAGSLQLFGEAVALATRWGLSREQTLEAIGASPAVSQAVKARTSTMYAPDAPADFPLRLARKDLYLALVAGYEKGAGLPLVSVATETFTMAVRRHGTQDVGRIAAFIDEASA